MHTAQTSDNYFVSAPALQQRYQFLRRVTSNDAAKGKKKRKSSGLTLQQAKHELGKLERQLLSRLTPQLMRDILISEVYAPRNIRSARPVILPRLLQLAAASTGAAKQFAYLLIRATLFYLRPALGGEEQETPEHFLMLSFAGTCMQNEGLIANSPFVPGAYGYVAQLIDATRKGDKRAQWCLELLYRAVLDFGYNLEPIPEETWAEEDARRMEIAGSTSPANVAPDVLRMPFACPPKHAKILKLIFERSLKEAFAKADAVEKLLKATTELPVDAFEGFLSDLWREIRESVDGEHFVVLRDGRDKIVIDIEGLSATGLTSFAFVREDRNEETGWCPYPKVHVHLFWSRYGEHEVTRVTITDEGEVQGFRRPTWPVTLQQVLLCILFDAYGQIVLPKHNGQTGNERTSKQRKRRTRRQYQRHLVGEKVPVHPHFRKLAEGWRASDEQVVRSLTVMGKAPPPGMTFVDEFDREFPGPSQKQPSGRDLWEEHERLPPRLVYSDDALEEILAEVASFVP